jgi:hypothetical protein
MATPAPQTSIVGISSAPDNRPPFDASVYTVTAAYGDPNRNDMTINTTGRRPTVAARLKGYPYPKDVTTGP